MVSVKKNRKDILIAGAFISSSVLLQLPLPLVTRELIDNILPHKKVHLLNAVILGLVGFMLIKGISDLLSNYYLIRFREKVLFAVQLKLFRHVLKLNMAFFTDSKTGYLMSRVTNDVANLQGLLAGTILNLIKDCITFVVGATIIFIFHWRLAILSLFVMPLFIYSIRFFSGRIRRKSKEFQEKFALVWQTLQETLCGM